MITRRKSIRQLAATCALLLFACGAGAETPNAGTKVSFQAPAGILNPAVDLRDSNEIIFSAPPRESAELAAEIYVPVAEYLSKVLGKKVTYKYPGNWGVYQGQMQKSAYDLVFDGPHFNSWRNENIKHNTLVKVPGEHVFVVLVRKDDDRITNIKQLAGRTICAHAPPNLGTLTMLDQFDNPVRQPLIVNTKGWDNIYKGMIEGKCTAGVIPVSKLEQFEKNGSKTKVVFRGKVMPDNAFSAGPRLTAEEQQKISRALTAPEATGPTQKMRQKYAGGQNFVAASNQEFAGLSVFLRNEWGY